MDVTLDDFQVFYEQYPEPPTVHQKLLRERRQKYHDIYRALLTTPTPSLSSSDQLPDFVPTSIEKAGPGNYGSKQIDDGNEIVLLNDEVLTSVPNATLVLIDGNELERISVLFQFPQFLEHCPVECISVMVPRICTDSIEWSLDAQLAATEALYFVVARDVPHHIAKHIAWAALLMASKTDSPQLFDSCAEIVSMILPQLHRHDVLKLVVPDAVDMAMSNKPHERRLAARVIGSFEEALSREEVQVIFEDTALALAQDEDDSVRSIMAQSMASLAANLPMSSAEQRIWPVLKMLTSDANANVRAAAMRSLAKSAQAHSGPETTSPLYEALLKPIFLEECATAGGVAASDLRDVDDDTYLLLEIFSEVYGHFLCSVSHLLNNEQESWTLILNTLRQMVTCNGPTVRHWCAFNMPAIVSVCADDRVQHLNGVIPALAGDSDVETRVTLAAGIHEIAKSLANGPLRGDVIRAINRLFMDENPQVRMKVLAHFSELLLLLSPGEKANHAIAMAQIKAAENASGAPNGKNDRNAGASSRTNANSEPYEEEMRRLKPMFTALEQMSFDSWRTQKLLAEELRKSANLIPQEMLCEHVAPLLFQMARESTFLVRKSAMHALIYTVRYIPDIRKRNHILKHFRHEWARGKVYWTRLAYIEAAGCAKGVFSSRLFTELFKDEILAMYGDLVPNVRLRLIRFLTFVAPIWKELPDFQESLSRLTSDKDSEVSREAHSLLRSLTSVKSPSAIEVEKDKALEVAESAFYVHRSKKKRKVHQRSGEQHGMHEAKSGRAVPSSVRDDSKQVNRSSSGAQPQPQQKKSIREGSVPISRKSGLPPGTDTQNTRTGDNQVQSVSVVSATMAESGKKQARHSRQHSKVVSGQSSPSRPPNGQANAKKAGFFSKLLSSCFGT